MHQKCKINLRDLNPEYLEFYSLDPVGGGNYRKCLVLAVDAHMC